MRKFIRKALQSLTRLPEEQVRRLLREMGRENEDLETVLSSLPGGVIVSDISNRVIFINLQARRMIPIKRGEYMEQPLEKVILDTDIKKMVVRALNYQETIRNRDFALERGGRNMILSCSMLPLVRDGRIRGNLLYIEDVTEIRADSARLRRAESLASLTTMTAGVAHEIKNPLGSMGIYIQLMQKLLNKDQDCEAIVKHQDDLLQYLDIVNEEVDRLNSIVMNYLFTVRPLEMEPVPTDLNELVQEILAFVKFELDENKIRTEITLSENLPMVYLDRKMIKQVLLNLVKNAQAAMTMGGELRVRSRFSDDQVVLTLSDTGGGIPEEIQAKIFEPYFTTKEEGSGLGLTLVYKIMKEHGGDIQMTSKEGEGTDFHLFFSTPQKKRYELEWEGDKHEL